MAENIARAAPSKSEVADAIGGVRPEFVSAVDLAIGAAGAGPLERATYAGPLAVACKRFDIATRFRLAHFAAQLGHESGGFKKNEEYLDYSAARIAAVWPKRFPTVADAYPYAGKREELSNLVYANRLGNGNVASGDGWRYRGRGLIQLTGRANYASAARALGLPFESEPDQLFKPWNSALVAGWFWSDKKCNRAADLGAAGIEAVTRLVNGGTHGIEDRAARFERALAALPENLAA